MSVTARYDNRKFFIASWASLGADTEGDEIQYPTMPVKTVQISGELSGASVTLEGSMDGTSWVGLRHTGATDDEEGTTLLAPIAGVGMFVIHESPRYVRPVVSDGDGDTDVSVILVASALQGG